MITLFSELELKNAKCSDGLPCECEQCHKTFFVKKRHILYELKSQRGQIKFCSQKCFHLTKNGKTEVQCLQCNKFFTKANCQIKQTQNNFCCKSCAAIYNNHMFPKRKKVSRPKEKIIKPKKLKTCKICKGDLTNTQLNENKSICIACLSKKEELKKSKIRTTCIVCGTILTEENCYRQKRKNGYKTYSKCKKCHNKFIYFRLVKLKQDMIYKMGGKCMLCGHEYHYSVYDLHHIDVSVKEFSWNHLKFQNKATREEELKKCLLLCANCHRKVHLIEKVEEPNKKFIQSKNNKICLYCGTLTTTNNSFLKKKKYVCYTYCKKCFIKLTLFNTQELKQKIVHYKGEKCVDCGEIFDSRLYDLHHINQEEKEFNISSKRISFEKLKPELDKCVLLCPNCHRIRHIHIIEHVA